MLKISENFHLLQDSTADTNIGYDGENLARTLTINGAFDTTAVYYLETKSKDEKLLWGLTVTAENLTLPLTSALLSAPGYYTAQVSQHKDDVVRKTNCFLLRVGESVNAVETAPPVEPSLFEVQIAQMADYLQQAEEVLEHGQIDISAERTARENADNALDQRVTYLEEHGGGGTSAVTSVNGKDGRVVLTAADIATNNGETVENAIAGKQDTLTNEDKQRIADMYDDSEIVEELNQLNRDLAKKRDISNSYDKATVDSMLSQKMQYKILVFDGTAFSLDGTTLTFSEIKSLCLNTADFVYALYSNRLYIPQYISNSNIFFEASYIDSDIPQMHRISINSSNQVSQFSYNLAKTTQIPTALPTPNKLTFTGAVTGEFDGSEPLSINIPTGGGGGATLIADLKVENTMHHINVIDVDFANGLLTVDNTEPFTEDVSTTVKICFIPIIDGIIQTYKFGMMPKELYDDGLYGVKINGTQIRVYKGSNPVSSFTNTSILDCSRFYMLAEKTRHQAKDSITVMNVDFTHKIKVLARFKFGSHFASCIDVGTSDNPRLFLGFSSVSNRGYKYVNLSVQDHNLNAFWGINNNDYEFLSNRGNYYSYPYRNEEVFYELDFEPIGNDCIICSTKSLRFTFGKQTITENDALSVITSSGLSYLQSFPNTIKLSCANSWMFEDGCWIKVYDMGVV